MINITNIELIKKYMVHYKGFAVIVVYHILEDYFVGDILEDGLSIGTMNRKVISEQKILDYIVSRIEKEIRKYAIT